MSKKSSGWIGVDLDGTLAYYDKYIHGHIGEPIAPMVNKIKEWLAKGKTVKIFTARISGHGKPLIGGGVEDSITPIKEWCKKHIGKELEITNVKDFGMVALYDDRAFHVIKNTGIIIGDDKEL